MGFPRTTLPIAGGATVERTELSGAARFYPFRGAFFVGCAFGGAHTRAAFTKSSKIGSADANMSTTTLFAMPQLGFLYRFSFGLALGADIGLEIPLTASTTAEASANGAPVAIPTPVRDVTKTVEPRRT